MRVNVRAGCRWTLSHTPAREREGSAAITRGAQFDWKVGFLTDVRFTSVTAVEVLLVESTIADVFGGTGDVVIPDSIMGQHPSLSASLDLRQSALVVCAVLSVVGCCCCGFLLLWVVVGECGLLWVVVGCCF